jgi:hypothetical protein
LQQHTPWFFRQKPPLGWPKEAIQKWLQTSGAVGQYVETKQTFPGGNVRSPAINH